MHPLFRNFNFFVILCGFSFLSCERIAEAAFSEKDDLEMGVSIDKEIRSKPEQFPILKDSKLELYLQSIVNQVLRSPYVKKKGVFTYKVTIIDNDEVINAFCTPGGFIYVYTGLIRFLENEATLAAVLAHEIAHAEKRHVRQRMISAMGLQIILSALIGNESSFFKEMGVQLVGSLALLSNSRGDELEADEWGFLYLKSSPYYQGAMSYFFQKVMKEEKSSNLSNAIESLLSSHPIPEERLRANSERIRKEKIQPPISANLLENRYNEMFGKSIGKFSKIESKSFEGEE